MAIIEIKVTFNKPHLRNSQYHRTQQNLDNHAITKDNWNEIQRAKEGHFGNSTIPECGNPGSSQKYLESKVRFSNISRDGIMYNE